MVFEELRRAREAERRRLVVDVDVLVGGGEVLSV